MSGVAPCKIGAYFAYTLYVNFGPRNAHFWTVKTTQPDQERTGNLSLNQSIGDLKPAPTADRNNSLFDYYTWKDETKIATNLNSDKKIRIIVYESSLFQLQREFKLGISKKKSFILTETIFTRELNKGLISLAILIKS
ncbi:hypothetical protein skT53_08380 [Effusibacillus dendaii]|uniref:Uncharacterized protein n=1 Tax=Effusibacillus dendaii TaxID=2743772 RepID=A0A7I8D6T6_9BACL|nr:hypothetical protein skT53_08380 [Effusibacillus dendaii]